MSPGTTDHPGIIKCLPAAWVKESGGEKYIKRIRKLIDSGKACWHMSFPTKPRIQPLHLYVVFGGCVQFRVNIVEFKKSEGAVHLSYGADFTAKYWAICSGPMVIPSPRHEMRGFRGYRYTEGLF